MSEVEPLPDEVPPSSPPKGAMGAIFMIVLADLMGFGIMIPQLPFYARHFAASDLQVGFLFAIYSACQLIATPILGLMSDRYGRRPVLILSQIGSVLGYLLLAVAVGRTWGVGVGLALVYLSRVIDGISGGNISTAQAYIGDVTTKETRAKSMGMLGAAFGIGFAIGPVVGGFLGHFSPWLPAVAAAALSAVAAAQTWLRLPESRFHKPSEETEAWLHPRRFLPIIRNKPVFNLLLIFFFTMMAFVMLESTYALYLADTFGFGVLGVSLFFGLAGIVIITVQGGLIGKLTKRYGEWSLAIVGPLLVVVAMSIYVVVGFHPILWLLVIATPINATGRSLQGPTVSSLISSHSDPERQGATFGLFHMLGSLARVIGPIVATSVYTLHHTAPYAMAGIITLAIAIWTAWLAAGEKNAPPVTTRVEVEGM